MSRTLNPRPKVPKRKIDVTVPCHEALWSAVVRLTRETGKSYTFSDAIETALERAGLAEDQT